MIFTAFERMVALRYLRARRREGVVSVIALFSLLGIGLGVGTLIVVMAVMNGFQHELLGRILALNGHLGVYGQAGTLTGYDDMIRRIAEVPGVTRVVPTLEGQVMAAAPGGSAAGAVVRGVRPDDLVDSPLMRDAVRWADGAARFQGDDAVVVGDRLAGKLGLKLGDRITLISPKGQATAFGTMPRLKPYTIVGTFNVGMFEYDSGFVYMPLDAAQAFFRVPEAVSHLEVFFSDPARAAAARGEVFQATDGRSRIYDWRQANAGFFEAVQVERNVMFLILTLIILVAAFNIISSLIMMVKDKGRDIAILRTMGATQGMIMRIFFLDGASVGILGTGLGVALGLAFAFNIESIRQWLQGITGVDLFAAEIYFLTELPVQVAWPEVLGVVAMALALSFAATIYPSWRAARLDPVEALRYE